MAHPSGETSNGASFDPATNPAETLKLLETLEEWNTYLEKHVPGIGEPSP